MPRSVTPTIADHSTNRLFTAVHLAAQIELIECYNFSALSQTVLQAPTTAAAPSSRPRALPPRRPRLVALGIVAQVLRLRDEKIVFVLG